jgi:hypothetical protein
MVSPSAATVAWRSSMTTAVVVVAGVVVAVLAGVSLPGARLARAQKRPAAIRMSTTTAAITA